MLFQFQAKEEIYKIMKLELEEKNGNWTAVVQTKIGKFNLSYDKNGSDNTDTNEYGLLDAVSDKAWLDVFHHMCLTQMEGCSGTNGPSCCPGEVNVCPPDQTDTNDSASTVDMWCEIMKSESDNLKNDSGVGVELVNDSVRLIEERKYEVGMLAKFIYGSTCYQLMETAGIDKSNYLADDFEIRLTHIDEKVVGGMIHHTHKTPIEYRDVTQYKIVGFEYCHKLTGILVFSGTIDIDVSADGVVKFEVLINNQQIKAVKKHLEEIECIISEQKTLSDEDMSYVNQLRTQLNVVVKPIKDSFKSEWKGGDSFKS